MSDEFHLVPDQMIGEHDMFLSVDFERKNNIILNFETMTVSNKYFSVKMSSPEEWKMKEKLMRSNKIDFMGSKNKIKKSKKQKKQTTNKKKEGITFLNPMVNAVKPCEFNLQHLDSDSAKSIGDVLNCFPKVFSELNSEEFPFDSLDLSSNQPVQSKIYRFPEAHKELVLEEMEKLWVVSKKDDADGKKQWRIVIDYRKLNQIMLEYTIST